MISWIVSICWTIKYKLDIIEKISKKKLDFVIILIYIHYKYKTITNLFRYQFSLYCANLFFKSHNVCSSTPNLKKDNLDYDTHFIFQPMDVSTLLYLKKIIEGKNGR